SFFLQAEDRIRDFHVTGVQARALPIWLQAGRQARVEICPQARMEERRQAGMEGGRQTRVEARGQIGVENRTAQRLAARRQAAQQIGRASCRDSGKQWAKAEERERHTTT